MRQQTPETVGAALSLAVRCEVASSFALRSFSEISVSAIALVDISVLSSSSALHVTYRFRVSLLRLPLPFRAVIARGKWLAKSHPVYEPLSFCVHWIRGLCIEDVGDYRLQQESGARSNGPHSQRPLANFCCGYSAASFRSLNS